MNDDQHAEDRQLQDAYARLGTALLPPPDVAVRVEREVGARRRRRRTVVAGAAVLVVASAVGGAVALGSGDGNDGDTVAVDQPGAHGSFVLTRQDGSSYTFEDLTLSCTENAMGEPAESGHIYLYSPWLLGESGDTLSEPFFDFEAAVNGVDGKTFELPTSTPDEITDGDDPFVLFAAESKGDERKRPNEVSSNENGAVGTVRVVRASCDPTPVLQLEVDTTLGSEVQQGTLDLAGSFG
jgi:hypothetical protein